MSVSKFTTDPVTIERSRVGETATFLRRAMLFLEGLKRKRYPNASTLARMCGCSRSTAVRTIDRLRYEFGVPIEYEEAQRGYYLTQEDFSFVGLPPSREEALALCVLSDFARMLGHTAVHDAIESLWVRVVGGRSDIQRDQIRERLSIEHEGSIRLSGINVLTLIGMCCHDCLTHVRYLSPWMSGDGVEYIGRLERLRVVRGAMYVAFRCIDGTCVVLNTSFIIALAVIPSEPSVICVPSAESHPEERWYSGSGSWSGAETEVVEVTIAPPASKYYAAQVWHVDQEDSWREGALVRRFPSVVSAELAARLLGLGRAIVSVRPGWILEQLEADITNLRRVFEDRCE